MLSRIAFSKKTFCMITSVEWDMSENYVNTVRNGLSKVSCIGKSSLYLYISVDLAFVMEIVNTLT